jgi:hypothetical protein
MRSFFRLLTRTASCFSVLVLALQGDNQPQPPVSLQSCVFAPLYEPLADVPELDVNSQLEVVFTAMQISSPGRPCRAAAEALCSSTSLPPFTDLGVSLVDSMAVDASIVGGHYAASDLGAHCVYQLVGSLQHTLLLTLQQQLQPVASLSKLHASAHSLLDEKLEQLVKAEVCAQLGNKRAFRLAEHADSALCKMLAATCGAGTSSAAASAAAAGEGAAATEALPLRLADGAAASTDTAVQKPPALATACVTTMTQRLLGCISISHLRERVELFQQSSQMGAAELLQLVMSPLLVPQLLSATMTTAAMTAALLPDFSSAAQRGGLAPAVVAQIRQLEEHPLVQVFAAVMQVSCCIGSAGCWGARLCVVSNGATRWISWGCDA